VTWGTVDLSDGGCGRGFELTSACQLSGLPNLARSRAFTVGRLRGPAIAEVAMKTASVSVLIAIVLIVGSTLSIMNRACKSGYHLWCAPMSTLVRHHNSRLQAADKNQICFGAQHKRPQSLPKFNLRILDTCQLPPPGTHVAGTGAAPARDGWVSHKSSDLPCKLNSPRPCAFDFSPQVRR